MDYAVMHSIFGEYAKNGILDSRINFCRGPRDPPGIFILCYIGVIKQIFQTIPGSPMFLRKNVIIGPRAEARAKPCTFSGCLNEGTFFPRPPIKISFV